MTRLIPGLVLSLIVLLAACQPTESVAPTVPPPGTFVPQERDVPTFTPPPWTEPGALITLQNVPEVIYLGRLEAEGIPSSVYAYAFSPDGTQLAGLNNEQLILWDLITGTRLFATGRSDALFVFFGLDKEEIFTVTLDGIINIYDTISGRIKDTLQGKPQEFSGVALYDTNTGYLALGGRDGEVKVWDIATRTSLVTIQAHDLRVNAVDFSSDGEQLLTSGDEGTTKLWDWRTRTALTTITAPVYRAALSPDDTMIAVGEADQITLWNASDGSAGPVLPTGPRAPADYVAFSPDGEYLINGGTLPSLTIWDAQTGAYINVLPNAGGDSPTMVFSQDGQLLLTTVLGGDVILWDVTSFREGQLRQAILNLGTRQMFSADWSPDNFLLAFFEGPGPIQLWGIPRPPATPTPNP
jgi:WD40 repeat protein